MDSDAVISSEFEKTSLNSFVRLMQKKLDWNPREKPMVFNQVAKFFFLDNVDRMDLVGGAI
jgi:hypothetical protein